MSSAETEDPIDVTATAVDRPKFPAVVFNIALAEVAKLGEQFRGLTATDNKSYEVVKKARATMRSGRTELDRRRKALKADAVAYGKLVDSNAKQIEEAILEVENPLANEIERYETERDRARLEAEEAERRQREETAAQADRYIGPFFAALGRGDDLWGNAPTYRIAHGVRPDVADAIKRALQGWTVDVTLGCAFTGPGGRGEVESTYLDPKVCAVLVHRPQGRAP